MAQHESSISMTDLDKKSTDELGERLSIDDGAIDDDGILPGDTHIRRSGMFGTVSNLINTVIGSGVLGLPSSIAKTGWALGSFLLVFSALVTWTGLRCLTACAHRLGGDKTSFGAVAARTYPWMMVLVDFCVVAVTFGICVAYMTIAAGILPFVVEQFSPELTEDDLLTQNWLWLLIAWGCFAAPLSMLKSVTFLGYTSAMAVLCVLYTTLVVSMYAFGILDPCAKTIPEGSVCVGDIVALNGNASQILVAVPVFFTSFCCAPSIFNIYNDIKGPSTRRLDLATLGSLAVCTSLYLIIALAGYFTFGSVVTSNILDSYPVEMWATIARLGTAFVVTVSYPLLMHPARDSVVHAINVCAGGKFSEGKGFNTLFYVVAAIMNVLALFLAFFNVPLDLILSITGSIGVVNLSLTIPFLFYYKMFEADGGLMRKLCIPAIILSLAASVVCGYFSIAPLFGMV